MKTTCGIFIINSKQQILACHPTRHSPLQWDVPKGCQDKDETYLDTIKRELLEETGLVFEKLNINKFIDISKEHGTFVYKNKKKQLYLFLAILNDSFDVTTLKCSSNVINFKSNGRYIAPFPEIDAFTWVNFQDLYIFHESQQRAIYLINDKYYKFSEQKYNKKSDQCIFMVKSNKYG